MSGATKFTVLGGGAWGTALAMVARRAGHEVTLWARDEETVRAINGERRNPRYLPDIEIDEGIVATADLGAALSGVREVLVVVPAQTLRGVLAAAEPYLAADATLVLCAKGIERDTGDMLSAVVEEMAPGRRVAVLSGPSFATDVARRLPTAVAIAAEEEELAARLARQLSTRDFRCYSTDDLIGVEIGGALKNVLAIASGTVAGAGLGASAQAAMVTRGFVELRRIGATFGARPETLMGLSGLGDLILTCSSAQSRNFSYGLALGSGRSREHLPLAEGVPTAAIAAKLTRERGIEAPIIDAIDRLLAGRLTIAEAVSDLMSRPLKSEAD